MKTSEPLRADGQWDDEFMTSNLRIEPSRVNPSGKVRFMSISDQLEEAANIEPWMRRGSRGGWHSHAPKKYPRRTSGKISTREAEALVVKHLPHETAAETLSRLKAQNMDEVSAAKLILATEPQLHGRGNDPTLASLHQIVDLARRKGKASAGNLTTPKARSLAKRAIRRHKTEKSKESHQAMVRAIEGLGLRGKALDRAMKLAQREDADGLLRLVATTR